MTASAVSDETLGTYARREHELFRRVRNGTLPAEKALDGLQLVLDQHPFVSGGFFDSAVYQPQCQNVRSWNEELGWGFSDEEFALAEPGPKWPKWPTGPLRVPILVPYFNTPASTAEKLVQAIGVAHGGMMQVHGDVCFDDDYLCLASGVEHASCSRSLHWEVIDLGAAWDNYRTRTIEECASANPAHAGVLAAAAHFPSWVRGMAYGSDAFRIVPSVWLAGYRVRLRHADCFDWTLHLGMREGALDISAGVLTWENRDAVPSILIRS